MAFERKLDIDEVRDQFKNKLIQEDRLKSEQAEQAANAMSAGTVEQVQKDLFRHQGITVINKITGRTMKIDTSQFADAKSTSEFLRGLARDNEELYTYLTQYLHQGAFLHLSELLLSYYFAPETQFRTANRQAIFCIEEDGSIEFTEKFDIEHIRTSDPATGNSAEYQTAANTPIATLSLSSKMKQQNNQVEHTYNKIDVKVHDEAAKKFIEDPRGKFMKFISWVKDVVNFLFSSVERRQHRQREALISPNRRL